MAANEIVNGRRISRRDMLKGVAGGTLAAILTGCTVPAAPAPAAQPEAGAPAAAPAAAAPGAIEVTWASHIYEPWNNALSAQGMQYMQANSNVKIVYSPLPFEQLNTKFVTAIASGKPYDIMGVYGPWMPQLLDGNGLDEAQPEIVQDITDNFPPVMKESATFSGKLYAYVQHIGIPAPIINVDLWEKAGVTPSTTWDEFLAAQDKLNKKGADGKWEQLGATLTTARGVWMLIHFSTVLFSFGVKAWLSEDLKKAAFNTPVTVEALKYYKNFAHPDAPENAFMLGKSATEITGPWAMSAYKSQAPTLKYQALPAFGSKNGQVLAAYTWFWVVAKAAKPEVKKAAWDFLKWLSAPDQYAAQYRNVGLLPITKKLPAELEKDEWAQTFSKNLNYAQIYYPKVNKWEQIELAISEELERTIAGEIKEDEAIKNAEDKVNAILAG